MRYQPTSGKYSLIKNSHVHQNWTNKLLDKFMSYFSNLRYTASVPFEEYEHGKKDLSDLKTNKIFNG